MKEGKLRFQIPFSFAATEQLRLVGFLELVLLQIFAENLMVPFHCSLVESKVSKEEWLPLTLWAHMQRLTSVEHVVERAAVGGVDCFRSHGCRRSFFACRHSTHSRVAV